ncbi:MAG: excinuclease ABC subunit A [Bacteroidetes bacterium GWE2_29_8]|nr:MAG: excinuclease ABC subunit A [Bacteroidetes bacterium GWE2_29_8]OFY20119.1 MAG: excinuclease ABC subunit A [Bacteroidetes bacterium GWF2_29_10]
MEEDYKDFIVLKGVKQHNLKNIDVFIPRNKFVVITGLSGSGKSSLAYDTLYAEGQRRYVESLSSYVRQFLGKIDKPDVEYIYGLSPAVAIEQKVNIRNPRSTVGTSTEVYEYVKMLFTSIGQTISPTTGNVVKKSSAKDIVNFIVGQPNGSKIFLLFKVANDNVSKWIDYLKLLQSQGYSRVYFKEEIVQIVDLIKNPKLLGKSKDLHVLVDRLIIKEQITDQDNQRIYNSVETALYEGLGQCYILLDIDGTKSLNKFTDKFEDDGVVYEEPSANFFSFNSPYGACPKCEGFGTTIGIDEDLVVPNRELSIYDDAVAAWKGEKMQEFKMFFIKFAEKRNFPVHRSYVYLTESEKNYLWKGEGEWVGINGFFKYIEEQSYKIQYRVMLSKYRGKTICPDCNGSRIRPDANYVYVGGKNITDLVNMPISDLLVFMRGIVLGDFEKSISKRLLIEMENRLEVLNNVGLGYLTLNRSSSTLSGGESQRINLATSIGGGLVDSMYILDEPSIGLHSKDTERLIIVLRQLRDLGNTVIVVEHDEAIMRAADYIIDMGPMAGNLGGEVVFAGLFEDLMKESNSLTAKYLRNELCIEVPEKRRKWREYINILGARENNLKGFDVKIPLRVLTVVTGVSGSGKTSLIRHTLYSNLKKQFGGYIEKKGKCVNIEFDLKQISSIEFIDQNPIGKSSRSNPVTYIKAFDDIRTLFAEQQLSKVRGYKPGYFSFNVEGGRCEECEGEGFITIEMQFMADVKLKCDSCNGKRYKEDVLEVDYKGKNIYDVLEMTVDESIDFFRAPFNKKHEHLETKIVDKLKYLSDVGLGYIKLGQASSTLSGGEAQRIKLASFLTKGSSDQHILFIFDEPTMGLHFHDINKLLYSFNALIEYGHSIIVIEHNIDVIKCADWIIDIGPEGGDKGGEIIFEGTPEDLVKDKSSKTSVYLEEKLKENVCCG